jgi:OmpA-OmpF porin, OOP family
MNIARILPVISIFLLSQPTFGQETVDVNDIVKSLKAKSSTTEEVSATDVMKKLRAKIAVVPRVKEAVVAPLLTPEIDSLSQVNLEIFFDYDSDSIRTESFQSLIALGNALSSSSLAGAQILVAGHTDAKGEQQYNLQLSEKRAAAVKAFLSASFPHLTETLFSIGFGEMKLRNPSAPDDAANRRVQIINIGKKS